MTRTRYGFKSDRWLIWLAYDAPLSVRWWVAAGLFTSGAICGALCCYLLWG